MGNPVHHVAADRAKITEQSVGADRTDIRSQMAQANTHQLIGGGGAGNHLIGAQNSAQLSAQASTTVIVSMFVLEEYGIVIQVCLYLAALPDE